MSHTQEWHALTDCLLPATCELSEQSSQNQAQLQSGGSHLLTSGGSGLLGACLVWPSAMLSHTV